MKKPRRFAIWGNTEKPIFWETLPSIISWSKENNLEIYLTTRINKKMIGNDMHYLPIIETADDFLKMDFVLTIGGDGTILSAARAIAHRNVPILGIHLGELGFMAKVILSDLFDRLNLVARGKYQVDPHMAITAKMKTNGQQIIATALNEVVIDNGKSHRMLTCRLEAGNRMIGQYRADGVIFSTPTGSTAYSLSAGGPIVESSVKTIIITPICPHSLTSRPLVVPDTAKLKVTFPPQPSDEIGVILDGQIHHSLDNNSTITITKADYTVPFITFNDTNYYQTLRSKMGWGTRGEEE